MADIKDVSNFVFFVSNSVDNLIKKNSENIDKKYIEKVLEFLKIGQKMKKYLKNLKV